MQAKEASAVLPTNFVKTPIAENFNEPSDFAFAPDGRIFVAEIGGVVKVIKNGTVLAQPFVIVPALFTGDRGLLGITLDPNFSSNRYVYLFYTHANPDEIRVVRYTESNDQAVPGSAVILLKSNQPLNGLHMGGPMVFGSDGKMYVGVGDNSIGANAQDLSNIHGKILRMNPDGSAPSDNPFYNQSGKNPLIWAYGFRNPFRMSFSKGGKLFVGDVGGSTHEEINVAVKGGNFGWPNAEGTCTNCSYVNPIYSYPTGNGAAVVAGFVNSGNNFPSEYGGSFFFGDYVRGFIKRLTFPSGQPPQEVTFDDSAGTVVSMKQGPNGALYYLTIYPGGLFKVEYNTGNKPPTGKIAASPTQGKSPLTVQFSSSGSSDPDGDNLKYKWNFGDGGSSTSSNPTHTYQNRGIYTASLIVNDGKLDSPQVSVQILVDEEPPNPVINSPATGTKYNAGDTINFSGDATDKEDGVLPASAFSWKVDFHHGDHTHPFVGPINGVKSGQFTIPDRGEPAANTFYRIILTVRDSKNLATTTTRDINPNKVNLTLTSNTPGLGVRVNSQLEMTPYTFESVVGFKHDIDADSPQNFSGGTYTFTSWSDGGAKFHTITTPNTAASYTANFTKSSSNTNVSKYTVVSGDIKVNGQALFDNDGKTGLVTLFEEAAEVEAPWGMYQVTNPDMQSAEAALQRLVNEMKTNGCGGGCNSVTEVRYPSQLPPSTVEIKPGETKTLKTYTVIAGDVKVNNQALYDNKSESGLIVLLEQDASVFAQWGATAFTHTTRETAITKMNQLETQMKQNGCGSACSEVIKVFYPENAGLSTLAAPEKESAEKTQATQAISKSPKEVSNEAEEKIATTSSELKQEPSPSPASNQKVEPEVETQPASESAAPVATSSASVVIALMLQRFRMKDLLSKLKSVITH